MIYLIGGPPRSGKTTLAKKLSKKLKIGWISADTLESIVREYTPQKDLAKLFPKNVLRNKTKSSNDLMYFQYSGQQIMQSYLKQGKAIWKAIEAFVSDNINEGHDFVIEGHQIHPQLVATLSRQFKISELRSIFLVKEDINSIVSGALKNKAKNDWFLKQTKDPKTYIKIATMLSLFGKHTKKEAKRYGYNVLVMDDNFNKMLLEGIEILTNKR
jgi:2-phosphoglycerate kinase